MSKTILITGSTDGIGLDAASQLLRAGHRVLLHGRSADKLKATEEQLSSMGTGTVECFLCDLSDFELVRDFAAKVQSEYSSIDVLINNAGIFKTSETITPDGLDIRFAVNTIAPYLLTQELLPLIEKSGRIINVVSGAQASVSIDALLGERTNLEAMDAYSQSKLAMIMWSNFLAASLGGTPVIVSVNPGSMLDSKMVRESFDVKGRDISIGSDILFRLALDDTFSNCSGLYYDNDGGQFNDPHLDALDSIKNEKMVETIELILNKK